MLPAAAVALLLAAQPQSSPPQDLATSLAPPSDLPPTQRAAALAVATLAFGCVQRLSVATSAADFARGSDELGAKLAHDYPVESATVRLDGDGGRGCRVRYSGPLVDKMWSAFADFPSVMGHTPDGGGCTVGEKTDLKVRAVCIDTAPKPPHRGDLVIERSATAAELSAALLWLPPVN